MYVQNDVQNDQMSSEYIPLPCHNHCILVCSNQIHEQGHEKGQKHKPTNSSHKLTSLPQS